MELFVCHWPWMLDFFLSDQEKPAFRERQKSAFRLAFFSEWIFLPENSGKRSCSDPSLLPLMLPPLSRPLLESIKKWWSSLLSLSHFPSSDNNNTFIDFLGKGKPSGRAGRLIDSLGPKQSFCPTFGSRSGSFLIPSAPAFKQSSIKLVHSSHQMRCCCAYCSLSGGKTGSGRALGTVAEPQMFDCLGRIEDVSTCKDFLPDSKNVISTRSGQTLEFSQFWHLTTCFGQIFSPLARIQ